MSLVDPIADAMVSIKNSDNASKKECMFRPASKLLGQILKVISKEGYIGKIEPINDGREGIYKIELLGKINECGVIKPRFPVKKAQWAEWEQIYIPGIGFGILIVSTPQGLMTNEDAKKQEIGGRLVAYIY